MFRFALSFLIGVLFSHALLLAQSPCGHVATPQNIDQSRGYQPDFHDLTRGWTRGIRDIPVKFHVIQQDDGSGGLSVRALDAAIQDLNERFLSANLRFVRYDAPNYVRDSRFYFFEKAEEETLARRYEVPNVINVFCVGQMEYCGYAYFPGSRQSNRVVMHQDCFENGTTFPHEIGHFFGLFHTHGKSNEGTTDEAAGRGWDLNNNDILDCEEFGDECCDTPADPNLWLHRDFCLPDCAPSEYFKLTDEYGDAYNPMVTNLMSYNPNQECRQDLTEDQIARIEVIAREARYDLKVPDLVIKGKNTMPVSGKVFFERENGQAMPVDLEVNLYHFQDILHSGDAFTFSATNTSEVPLYLYIINMDIRKEVVGVFPLPSESPMQVAGGRFNLGDYIYVDNNPGAEYACLLYTREPLDFPSLVQALQRTRGTFTQRLYDVLGQRLLLQEQVTYQKSYIQFQGALEANQILPVMLEMVHK